jgi:integrase
LQTLLAQVRAVAGLKEAAHIQPHSLRHAAATRLLRNGANLRDIQAFLGHSDLTTTAVYLHSDEESQRKMAELGALQPAAPESRPASSQRPANRSHRQQVLTRSRD